MHGFDKTTIDGATGECDDLVGRIPRPAAISLRDVIALVLGYRNIFSAHLGRFFFRISMARASLIQFYFDLCEDYKVYAFLPHRAAELYDLSSNNGHELRSHGATCFALAQKSIDVTHISRQDLAVAFGTDQDKIRRMEHELMPIFFVTSPMPPEHKFEQNIPADLTPHERDNAIRFFHLSVFEDDALSVRILAAIEAMRMHHSLGERSADAAVKDCANRLRSRTISSLGIRLAIAATQT